ncbi:MAG: PD-(D/E)XK nuclease family protein [Betaproteobacteria bacterium]|nr:PD-(D/E)XK nuclease family protein [Betaproteobacteria bacterium]
MTPPLSLDELLPAPGTLLPHDHLSATSLGTFSRCPPTAEQFRRRYMLGERQRPGGALIWGSADDYAHTLNFGQKIASGVDLPESDVTLAFAEGFDQEVERGGGPDEIDWGDDKPGLLKDRGARLAAVYHQQVSPSVQPVAVQEEFSYQVAGLPVPIIGRIDLETASALVEWKVTARVERQPKQHWRTQARLYQAAAAEKPRALPAAKPLEWHVKARTKTPTVVTAATELGLLLMPSPAAVEATHERVRKLVTTLLHLIRTFGPDEPWPTHAPDYGWACNWCGYRPSCPWWAGEENW